jgi:dihydropteroate synthase type 2
MTVRLLGILNITEDSFSDGGKFLSPDAARAQGEKLIAGGADILDIGAASSQPNARPVPPEIEITRLAAVLPAFRARGIGLSIDTFNPQVQRWALGQGIDYLNDIHGFPDAALYPELAASSCGLIVMHAVQQSGVAVRMDVPPSQIWDRVLSFFDARLEALAKAGIAAERIILDPGMGQFVGSDPENSLIVLRRLPELKARFGLPVLVSVSRKGFLRKLTGQPIAHIAPASLAAELFAEAAGADFIRTHDPAALRTGLKILKAIGKDAARHS